jgi:hypothetical protein
MKLSSVTKGTVAISGRQHVIADYDRITFGDMGIHVGMTEFSIASCVGMVTVGSAQTHAAASSHSKINMSCPHTVNGTFTRFVSAADYSLIDATGGTFSDSSSEGERCSLVDAKIYPPDQGTFPGIGTC